MTAHDPVISMGHMLAHAREAVEAIVGKERSVLDRERLLSLALVRLIEIVGEAASRVPPADQAKYPTIKWSAVISARNRLIHGYDSIDHGILWQTVTVSLPELVVELEKVPGVPEAAKAYCDGRNPG